MNKLRQKVNSLQTKILLAFFFLFLMFMGCSIAGYSLSWNNSYKLAIESMQVSLNQINSDTSRILLNAQNRAVEVAEDIDLQIVLRKSLPETMKEVYKERLNFNNKLYYESIRVEDIDGLYVVGDNGALFHATYSMRRQEFRNDEWYRYVMETGENFWMSPSSGSILGNNLDFETISIAVPIKDRASTKLLGVVVVDVQVKDLGQIHNGDIIFDGSVCILNENNEVIYMEDNQEDLWKNFEETSDDLNSGLNKQDINESLKEEVLKNHNFNIEDASFLTINGVRYLVGIMSLSDSDWKLMCLTPTDVVLSQVYVLRNILIGVSILIAVLGILFSIYASAGIVKPIRKMQIIMKEVENGNFTVRVEEDGKDEVGDLARGFNHMIYKVNESIENEREMQEKVKQADFNALQAQINPHFLYNTLDSINWMARMNRVDKVEEMIDSLTSFLRIGLSRGRVFITLQEELKHVESYISIQKTRYMKLLDYSIDIPEELFQYKVIKMILQPLVENAIYHGIKEQATHGTIFITGYETEKNLILCVEDDGLGMDATRLEEVREMMKNGIAQKQDAYGIINVQRRIQSYFGNEYGLSFISEYEKGTKVTITLPKQEVMEKNV